MPADGPRSRWTAPAAVRLTVGAVAVVLAMVLAVVPAERSRAVPASSCARAPAAGALRLQLRVGGRLRTALIHIPDGTAAGRRLALVLALHGFGGSGPKMERYSGLSRVADRDGFIVAYPSSSGLYWNSNGATRLPDDVRFIGALISRLEQTECVNRARVFVTGVSNGGGMAALAACRLSPVIAAVAPVAGGYDGQPACHVALPVSVLEIHGTSDQVVPYFGRGGRPTANGVPPFVNSWVSRDACRSAQPPRRLAVRTTLYRWTACAGGVSVEHIQIQAGRHQWPGATPPDPGPPATICAACTVWRFFSALPAGRRSFPPPGGAALQPTR